MTETDIEGYGARPGQTDTDRLLEDSRTLSPSGIERIAQSWSREAGPGWSERSADHHDEPASHHGVWHDAERAALQVLERADRAPEWAELRKRVLDLTERQNALVAWRQAHGKTGHRAEDALLGAMLALLAGPDLDARHARALLAPMSAALPWLAERVGG